MATGKRDAVATTTTHRHRLARREKPTTQAEAPTTRCHIDDLPDEVILMILGHGDCTDLYKNAPAVSMRWRALAGDTWTRVQPPCGRRPHNSVDHVGPYIASITGDGAVGWRSYAHAEGCPMRARASIHAARDGRITVLYVLCRMLGHPWVPGICITAAARGHLDVLTYASAHGHPYDEAACEAAAVAAGQYVVLDWLWKLHPPLRANVDRAAETGDIHLLRVLQARRCPRGKGTVAAAARGGHMEAVVWLLRHRCPWGASAIAAAAGNAHIGILKLLLARWTEPVPLDAMEAAVSLSGDRACVDLLWARIVADGRRLASDRDSRRDTGARVANGTDGDVAFVPPKASYWLALAARRGDLALVEHLANLGCRPIPAAFAAAATEGHIGVLRALEDLGRTWDTSATASAASRGRLEALRHLHERGCPWNESTCIAAAGAGHVDCLAYAHAHGCPWDARVYVEAVHYGHVHVLAYAVKMRCPHDDTACHAAAVWRMRSPQASQFVRRQLCRHRAGQCRLWSSGTTRWASASQAADNSTVKRTTVRRMVPHPLLGERGALLSR